MYKDNCPKCKKNDLKKRNLYSDSERYKNCRLYDYWCSQCNYRTKLVIEKIKNE